MCLRRLGIFPILSHRKLLDHQKRRREEGRQDWEGVEGGWEADGTRRLISNTLLPLFFPVIFLSFSAFPLLLSFLFPPLFLAVYYENTILELVVGFSPWGQRWNFKSLTIIQLYKLENSYE